MAPATRTQMNRRAEAEAEIGLLKMNKGEAPVQSPALACWCEPYPPRLTVGQRTHGVPCPTRPLGEPFPLAHPSALDCPKAVLVWRRTVPMSRIRRESRPLRERACIDEEGSMHLDRLCGLEWDQERRWRNATTTLNALQSLFVWKPLNHSTRPTRQEPGPVGHRPFANKVAQREPWARKAR